MEAVLTAVGQAREVLDTSNLAVEQLRVAVDVCTACAEALKRHGGGKDLIQAEDTAKGLRAKLSGGAETKKSKSSAQGALREANCIQTQMSPHLTVQLQWSSAVC